MSVFTATAAQLQKYAEVHPAVLVAYSSGKDSLVVLDLCCRAFSRVVALYAYFVPGLALAEEHLRLARERWKVQVLEYPMPSLLQFLRNGIYCPNHHSLDDLPRPKSHLHGLYEAASVETGIDLVATGIKKTDGLYAAGNIKAENGCIINPILKWRNQEILAYLAMNKIPIPPTDGRQSASFDMTTPSLLWLHDKHPEDFAKVCRWFPYAPAVVHRRDWYGIC